MKDLPDCYECQDEGAPEHKGLPVGAWVAGIG